MCNDKVETNDDEPITASRKFEADKSENGETMLSREVGTPVTELKSNESYNNMIQRIVSSQQSIQDICVGIKELQTIVSASSNQGDKTSKSIEKLVEGVSKSQDQVRDRMHDLKLIESTHISEMLQWTTARKAYNKSVKYDGRHQDE